MEYMGIRQLKENSTIRENEGKRNLLGLNEALIMIFTTQVRS